MSKSDDTKRGRAVQMHNEEFDIRSPDLGCKSLGSSRTLTMAGSVGTSLAKSTFPVRFRRLLGNVSHFPPTTTKPTHPPRTAFLEPDPLANAAARLMPKGL